MTLRLTVYAAGLIACFALPVFADDGERGEDRSGTVGGDNVAVSERGEDGTSGGTSQNGGAGGNIDFDVTPSTNVSISNGGGFAFDGGPGGHGGNGGNVTLDLSEAENVSVSSRGGDAGVGTQPGNGGKGGDVTIVSNGPVRNLAISAGGGDAEGTGGVGGAGGVVKVVLNGPVENLAVSASGGDSDNGPLGAGGSITVDINSDTKNVSLSSGRGDGTAGPFTDGFAVVNISAHVENVGISSDIVNVNINQGAAGVDNLSVSARKSATLTFNLKVKSREELARASAYLADNGNAANGSVEINGKSYTWYGFDNLIGMLSRAGVKEAKVSFGDDSVVQPRYLVCKPRGVVIAYVDASAYVFNGRKMRDQAYFGVGTFADGSFYATNPLGWTVEADNGRRKAIGFNVLDDAGELVAACKG